MSEQVVVVGLGGSMRAESTSLTALRTALEGAASAGAQTQMLSVRELDLPMYSAEHGVPDSARTLVDAIEGANALILSSPTYQGSMSGAVKNALDWLILLGEKDPAYLTNKPVGLVSTAGGVQGLQTINALEFSVRALRGWAVPIVLPVAQSWQVFDPDGNLIDSTVGDQLRALGTEVTRAARQFQREGDCDYSETKQFAATT